MMALLFSAVLDELFLQVPPPLCTDHQLSMLLGTPYPGCCSCCLTIYKRQYTALLVPCASSPGLQAIVHQHRSDFGSEPGVQPYSAALATALDQGLECPSFAIVSGFVVRGPMKLTACHLHL